MLDDNELCAPAPEGNFRAQYKQIFWTYPRFAGPEISQQEMENKLVAFKDFLTNKLENKPVRGRAAGRIRVLQLVCSAERHKDDGWHLHACAKISKTFGRTDSRYFDFEDHHPNWGKVRQRWWHAVKYVIKDGVFISAGAEDWDPEQLVEDASRKKNSSRHIVVKKMFTENKSPQEILESKEEEVSVKATILWNLGNLKAAWRGHLRYMEVEALAPDIGWDFEDLPLQPPAHLTGASKKMYSALIQTFHPGWPRGLDWCREAIYLHGPRKTGKSTLFKKVISRIVRTVIVGCSEIKNGFWPPVDTAADCVVLDEFGRGKIKMMDWKNLCDAHSPRAPLTLDIKGDKLQIKKTVIWVAISNSPPDQLWQNMDILEREPAVTRFRHVIETDGSNDLGPLIDYLKDFQPEREEEEEQ